MSRRKVGIRQRDQGRERQGKCTTYVLPAWLVLPVVLSAWLPREEGFSYPRILAKVRSV